MEALELPPALAAVKVISVAVPLPVRDLAARRPPASRGDSGFES